ncbi:PEP-CTERM sorting domain-containing protein [Inhella crocodyli]|uniref:PEP-CTERM sorting domain-containing protein n=1 Tax=Inhella crocodyli TaxID=2499851 RepID=A0A3S2UDB2_9BURK|nr:PEP-CTERM sorting domain-containing protein [Inhella crocodyli]RVT84970.1 PEP-CTERM sorting domain-containing protein [Inhella crocodyli]
MTKKLIRFLFAALVVAPAMSSAGVVQVSGPAGMSQGTYTTEDFEDGAFAPGAAYSASSGIRRLGGSGIQHAGNFGLTTNSFPDPITISFAAPTSSVGLWFGNDDLCCSRGFTAFMDVFDANGWLATLSVVANMNDVNDQFLGFISDELVTSVTVRYGSGSDVGLFHGIDDVMFNAAQVPEPGSLALGGLALLGFAASRKSRKK